MPDRWSSLIAVREIPLARARRRVTMPVLLAIGAMSTGVAGCAAYPDINGAVGMTGGC